MPLTLIAGIGGMSEWTMMTGQSNWKWSYPLLILGLVVVGLLNFYLLKGMETGLLHAKKKKKDTE